MKQGYRLITRPRAFFNQLQWSTNHTFILLAFLGLSAVETQLGREQYLNQMYSLVLQQQFGFNLDQALWLITTAKLVLMLFGAYLMATIIWFVGSLMGHRGTSRRVLFRRLSVVFTVLLGGYTLHQVGSESSVLFFAGLGLYLWGVTLGYFALREQFGFGHTEALVVGLFSILIAIGGLHFSSQWVEASARAQVKAMTRPSSHLTTRPHRR